MRQHRSLILATLIVLAGLVQASSQVNAGQSAKVVIDRFYGGLVTAMKSGGSFSQRKKMLAPLVRRTFSLDLMARIACGPSWKTLKPNERKAVTAAFADWAISNYASQFSSYDGEKFEVGKVTTANKNTQVVHTRIIPHRDRPVTLNYRILNGRVIDVYLKGTISQLATWRSEFSSVLKREGSKGFISRLQQKTRALAKH